MSQPRLTFRIAVGGGTIRIAASGCLDADTAHLLCKVVVGALRRFAVGRLELDLTAITRVDQVGTSAVQVSRREAQRRGVDFILTGMMHSGAPPRRLRATTGTVCARRPIHRLSSWP